MNLFYKLFYYCNPQLCEHCGRRILIRPGLLNLRPTIPRLSAMRPLYVTLYTSAVQTKSKLVIYCIPLIMSENLETYLLFTHFTATLVRRSERGGRRGLSLYLRLPYFAQHLARNTICENQRFIKLYVQT